jgi:hypothetical protein
VRTAGLGLLALLVVGLPPVGAQQLPKLPRLTGHPAEDFAAATKPAAKPDPAAPLPCMDIRVLTKLTPDNLVPTFRGCKIEVIGQLVKDTSAALDSAKAFTGSATGGAAGNAAGAVVGDNDAINCLTPALALFKAAMPTQAVAAVQPVPAVLNADGSVKVPAVQAVPATPANDPGPVLLYQKYREFTLAGALTSCQAWFNGPINATAAAGLGGAATVAGGAALLLPKP